jgi:RNA polymerase sigma factor (sigma-70 family)
MTEEQTGFLGLIQRIREGDQQAAFELVKSYESVIRVAVRARLYDPVYNRVFDSMDICQSVMASFFPRAMLGQYDFEEPRQLVALLITMAKSKVSNQIRHYRSQRRNVKRDLSQNETGAEELTGSQPTPSKVIHAKELMDQIRQRLSKEEQHIVELRQLGCQWNEVAERMGGTGDARRKQFQRMMKQLTLDLKLDDDLDPLLNEENPDECA